MADNPDDNQEAEPVYLSVEQVLGLYSESVVCTINQARERIIKPELLESAVLRPKSFFHYQGCRDYAVLAASLAYAIAEGQVFRKGNKRTALAVMLSFLEVNGFVVVGVSDKQLATWIYELSQGLTPEGLADNIRPYLDYL